MSGCRDANYSFYFDVVYTNGATDVFAMPFDCGTHDWQYQEWYFQPTGAIKTLVPVAMLRGDHIGVAWFDDLGVQELAPGETALLFDAYPVSAVAEGEVLLPDPASAFSNDFHSWKFDQEGRPVEIQAGGQSWLTSAPVWSGFIARDWQIPAATYSFLGTSTWVRVDELQQNTACDAGLSLQIQYAFSNRHVEISGVISNATASERFLTLFYALPLQPSTQIDWCTLDSNTIAEAGVYSDYEPVGNTGGDPGRYSRLPLAVVRNSNGGMGIYVSPRHHRFHRMAYQADMKALFIAFDFYLAPAESPVHASADFRFDVVFPGTNAPFREALADIYGRDSAYAKPEEDDRVGPWVAFSDVAGVPSSFHLNYHELDFRDLERSGLIRSDDAQGLQSFRYKAWPSVLEWQLAAGALNWSNYTEVLNYLSNAWISGTAEERENAEQIFSSGVRDAKGALVFFPRKSPWFPEPYGATFLMNPAPSLTNGSYPITKARYHWNTNAAAAYSSDYTNEWGTLDGEFVDDLEAYGHYADYDPEHLQASAFPLLYRRQELRPCIPVICPVQEFSGWLRDNVKSLGKTLTANGINKKFFFTAANYDVMVDEWYASEVESNPAAIYNAWMFKRMAAGGKPVCILYNNWNGLSDVQKDSLFRTCAFHGFSPSFYYDFPLAEEYWADSAHWEGDAGLFGKFIPLIAQMHHAGWRPVTLARADSPSIRTARFGDAPDLHLGLYNLSTQVVETVIWVDAQAAGFSNAVPLYLSWPLSNSYSIVAGNPVVFTQSLQRAEVVRLSTGLPFVGLANGAQTLETVETNFALAMTNNLFAYGQVSASNLANGISFQEPVVGGACTGMISLAWGTNDIAVVCSNQTGTIVTQMVQIVMSDQDGDRIPDWWELECFDLLDTADSSSDWDGDRIGDRDEYLSGTDPKDPESVLAMQPIEADDSAKIVLRWMSVTGKTYALLMSTNLLQINSFLPIMNRIPGNAVFTSVTDISTRASGKYFYQVKLE